MKTLDITKPVQTRDGKPARIVSTKLGKTYPLGAIITYSNGDEVFNTYEIGGMQHANGVHSVNDLINVPEKFIRWVNFNKSGTVTSYVNRQSADYCARDDRLACIKVEFEEGQGV